MIPRALDHLAHLLVEALIGLLGLAFLAGCVLAWRLAQGPIDITSLVRRELPALTASGARLAVGRASLAWEGFVAADSPIDIRLDDIVLTAADGAKLLTLPRGRVTLSLGQALRGRLVPRTVALDGADLLLQRTKAGGIQLDVGRGAGGRGNAVVAELVPSPQAPARAGPLPWLAQLTAVHIRGAAVRVQDAVLGLVWQARAADADLHRAPDGGVTGDARLDLAAGGVTTTLAAHATLAGAGTEITASASAVNPAAIARLDARLSPLGAVDAPLTLALSARFAPDFTPRALHLAVQAGPGTIHAGTGAVAIAAATADITATPGAARLTGLRVALAAPPGARAPPPTLTGSAEATRAGGTVTAHVALAVDRVAFADLAAYWPAGTGGGGRPWVVENITGGTAHDAAVSLTLTAPDDFSTATLTALTGGVAADNLTVWWLRPIPPLTATDARLVVEGPDAIRVDVLRGAQGPLRLDAGSSIRISGLAHKDQIGDVSASISGALPAALALLNNKRLNLLSRFPVSFTDPAGATRTRLTMRIPLDVHVTMDDITLAATSRLTGVHLGNIAAGRDLDGGTLKLAVDTNRLDLSGSGTVARIPADFAFFMDFRAGPRSQIVERATATAAAAPAAALQQAGAPAAILAGGTVGLDLAYTARRDTTATIDLSADLTRTVLESPAGWSKPAGTPASAAARLGLAGGRLAAITELRADGPLLSLRGHATTTAAASTLHIDRARIGRTDLRGTVVLPRTASPIRVNLSGPALDISPLLKDAGSEPAAPGKPGPAWEANLDLGRVILGRTATLAPVTLTAASDGRRITHARLDAGAGAVRAAINPSPTGRTLTIASADSGEVLLAAGIADNIRGGRLHVDATYDDAAPGAPLSGTATMDQFRVLDAPAVGRLLKALTLYGAVDLLRGPGLGFARAVVPFRWQQRVLTLESARAYSASLGLTAKGDVNLAGHTANLSGTVVPAYFFNTLLGHLPFVGHLFSPEKGGGVFAARYTVKGALGDPKVGVNPLSMLTPGFLRGVFGAS